MPDYISHQPPGLASRTPCEVCSMYSNMFLWMWRHTRMLTAACTESQTGQKIKVRLWVNVGVTCALVVLTAEWFVHVNICCFMLNVFPWWLFFLSLSWWFELNWCTLPWCTTAFEPDSMKAWTSEGLQRDAWTFFMTTKQKWPCDDFIRLFFFLVTPF